MTILKHNIALPADYQVVDFLNFHQRDNQQRAERVSANSPACLTIRFTAKHAHAELHIETSNLSTTDPLDNWPAWLEYFLGVKQPSAAFFQQHQYHPELGALLGKQPGLRVAQTSSPFEAISWAIIGQQISVAAALNIRRRFIELTGVQHL